MHRIHCKFRRSHIHRPGSFLPRYCRKRHCCRRLFWLRCTLDKRPCKYFRNNTHRHNSLTSIAPPKSTYTHCKTCIGFSHRTVLAGIRHRDRCHKRPNRKCHRRRRLFLQRCTPCTCCRISYRSKNHRRNSPSNIANSACMQRHSTAASRSAPMNSANPTEDRASVRANPPERRSRSLLPPPLIDPQRLQCLLCRRLHTPSSRRRSPTWPPSSHDDETQQTCRVYACAYFMLPLVSWTRNAHHTTSLHRSRKRFSSTEHDANSRG